MNQANESEPTAAVEETHTPTPWTVQRLHHANDELWLQIGFFDNDGREIGPICELVGGAVKMYRPVAEFQHLIAPEAEVRANAELIVKAVNSYATNRQTIATLRDAARMVVDWYEGTTKDLPDRTAMYNAACAALAMLAMIEKEK
jgi:hypothetical protein